MNVDYKRLRAVNIARQAEWPGNEKADLGFRALEVADEAGELMGAIKKYLRGRRGIAGATLSLDDIRDEMGDTIISLDLLAIEAGFPDLEPTILSNASKCLASQALLLDYAVGDLSLAVSECLRKIDRDMKPTLENEQAVFEGIDHSLAWVTRLAGGLGVDLGRAVATKFNKTSEKYGMITRF